jgi:hypothetical protein
MAPGRCRLALPGQSSRKDYSQFVHLIHGWCTGTPAIRTPPARGASDNPDYPTQTRYVTNSAKDAGFAPRRVQAPGRFYITVLYNILIAGVPTHSMNTIVCAAPITECVAHNRAAPGCAQTMGQIKCQSCSRWNFSIIDCVFFCSDFIWMDRPPLRSGHSGRYCTQTNERRFNPTRRLRSSALNSEQQPSSVCVP